MGRRRRRGWLPADQTASAGLGRCLQSRSPSPPFAPRLAAGWVEQHKALKPGNAELQAALDEWMGEFEAEEERRRAEALAVQQDDGWTLVQRHKVRRRGGLLDECAMGACIVCAWGGE